MAIVLKNLNDFHGISFSSVKDLFMQISKVQLRKFTSLLSSNWKTVEIVSLKFNISLSDINVQKRELLQGKEYLQFSNTYL